MCCFKCKFFIDFHNRFKRSNIKGARVAAIIVIQRNAVQVKIEISSFLYKTTGCDKKRLGCLLSSLAFRFPQGGTASSCQCLIKALLLSLIHQFWYIKQPISGVFEKRCLFSVLGLTRQFINVECAPSLREGD